MKIARYESLQAQLVLEMTMGDRKIILCALGRQDPACAREVYNQMPDAARATPMTKYLMFKVALRDGDTDYGMPVIMCKRNVADNAKLQNA